MNQPDKVNEKVKDTIKKYSGKEYELLKKLNEKLSATQVPIATGDPANPKVFLDISIGGKAIGRVTFQLYHHLVPRTAENFRCPMRPFFIP